MFINIAKKIIPKSFFRFTQPAYHYILALLGALIYHFPSRSIKVVGITGTKGKTSVTEIINAILTEAGFKTALTNTLRFKIGDKFFKNNLKMTMPGRFFIQSFLRKAANEKCDYFIMEVSSEGVSQNRHKFINFFAGVFTNLAPEHIESHGGFLNYKKAKLKFFESVHKTHIVNLDNEHADDFLNVPALEKIGYTIYGAKRKEKIKILKCESYKLKNNGIDFEIEGVKMRANLLGEFNLQNILAAAAFAISQNISLEIIKSALDKFSGIPGKMEFINAGQNFSAIVDYAHTPDSLEAVYKTLSLRNSDSGEKIMICVLGSAGGGRDKWKRPVMGRIAAKYCDEIILTNEDPYDENPFSILEEIENGFSSQTPNSKPQILNPKQIPTLQAVARKVKNLKHKKIIDRREAIREALKLARGGDTVVITGKGAEPWIMGPRGAKVPWDDREIVKEELKKITTVRNLEN